MKTPSVALSMLLTAAIVAPSTAADTAAKASGVSPDARPCILFLSGKVAEKEFGNPNKYQVRAFLPDVRLQKKLKEWGYDWAFDFFSTEMTWEDLQQFNAIVMMDFPNVNRFRGAIEGIRRGEELLRRYVQEGGGLLLTGHIEASQWGLERNTEEMNRFLQPWGAQVPLEQIEEQNPVLCQPKPHRYGISGLAWTTNVVAHPLTAGVSGFLYPCDYGHMCYFTHPVAVDDAWQVLLKASRTARTITAPLGQKAWRTGARAGSIASEPPLLAVREVSKGRVVLWPTIPTATFIDGYHQFWGHGLTMVSRDPRHPSEGERLIQNLLTWLVAPSRDLFGGYVKPPDPPEEEVGLVRINWDRARPSGRDFPSLHKGLIGMQSRLSAGADAPEVLIQAAREAGYDFAVFTEDLAQLDEAEFASLVDLCNRHCSDEFQVFAGFLYRDVGGNAWAVFGNGLHWPRDDWWHDRENRVIANNNVIYRGYQFFPLLMVHPNLNPEKPWFQGDFKGFATQTYRGGKLIDDATEVYRRLQGDGFRMWPVAVHLVGSTQEVQQAAAGTMPQSYAPWHELSDVLAAYSGGGPKYKGKPVFRWTPFVSSGPMVEAFRVVNFGCSDLAIPQNDRFRVQLRVTSERGLKEVRILDGPRLWRRFLPAGAREWDVLLDGFHDRVHHLMVVAIDADGRTAWSADRGTSVQEINVPRCSDNLNTFTAGKFKAQAVFPVRGLENYFNHRAGSFTRFPLIPGVEETQRFAVDQRLSLVSRFGYVRTDDLSHFYPPTATPNWNRNDIPELARPQTAVRGTVNMTLFTPWADGTAAYLVDGAFEALRDLDVPRGFVQVYQAPWLTAAETLVASRTDGRAETVCLKPRRSSWHVATRDLAYVANIGAFTGARAFIPLEGEMVIHGLRHGVDEDATFGFLGRMPVPEKRLKAGDTIAYRYLAVWSEMKDRADTAFVEDVCSKMGLRGATAYTVEPRHGEVVSQRFILTLRARDHGFAARIGAAPLPMLLPTFVEGLNDRWPAGIWYKGKHDFVVPVWTMNAVHSRFSRRTQRTHTDRLVRFGVWDGKGMLQIDTEIGDKDVFVGNLLVCDHPEVFLELEDWRKGRETICANNPTDQDLTVTIAPGPGFDLLGPFRKEVTLPAGGMERVTL